MQRQIPAAPTQVAPTQAAPTQAAPTQAAPTQAARTQATHLKSASTRSKPVAFSKAAAPPKTLDECKADSTPLEVARVHEMPRLLARPDAEPIRGMKQTQKLYSVKVASHNEAETAQGQPSAERTPANQKPVQRAVSVLSLMPQPDPQLAENAEPTSVLVPIPAKRQGTPELAPQPAPRTADAATTAEPLRQVQHLENLQLPLRDLTDSDLHPVERVAQRGGPAAPSPDDLFVDPNSLRNRKTDPLQFKDTTPIGGAQTQTQATQLRSRFDGVGVDSLDPPANEEAEAPLFQLPTVDQTTPEPSGPTFSLPESSPPSAASESVIEFGDQESSEPRSFQAEAIPSASAEPETTGDIESSVNKQLNQIDALPPVPANSNGESLPVPGQNPLAIFGEEPIDQNREQPPAELAVTNGRDCSGEGCREDMQLLRRREQTNMSLNITPSIEPTEVDMAKVEQSRIEKLSKAPTRTWTDRRGRVIADGNFDDFRNNKVYVRTVNGTIRRVPLHTLSDDDRCFVTAWWELPEECNFEGEEYQLRDFRLTTFTWVAAATCHKPLYFEQVGVERYGHSAGPIAQPIISGVHFFGDIVMLPYHAGLTPPKECIYTLGHYRPGDCAPWLLPGFPFSERAFKWEGLALGAAIALLP